jgi:hypothetical protein
VLSWKMSRLPAGPDTDPVPASGSKVAVMEHSSRSPGGVVSDDGQLRITRPGDEPWLFVAGEIDEYSYKSLIRTLVSVARDPSEIAHPGLGHDSRPDPRRGADPRTR